jgi:hypothetical protein
LGFENGYGTKLNEILEEKGERPIWVRKRQE